MMEKRPNDPVWKNLDMVQTCLKAWIGIGFPIKVWYYAELDEYNPFAEIQYDLHTDEADKGPIPKNKRWYAHVILKRVAYYISRIYNYEILRMEGDFLIDDNGQIWLYGASKIVTWVKTGCVERPNIVKAWKMNACVQPGRPNIFDI